MIKPNSENTTQEFTRMDWAAAGVADALASTGFCILPQALPAPEWARLYAEAQRLHAEAAFAPARIGRAEHTQRVQEIRGDALCWLTPEQAAGAAYLQWMQSLQAYLNGELFLNLREFEAHYAHYPAGAFYKKHVDRHREVAQHTAATIPTMANTANAALGTRVVSSVFYLNAAWPAEAGGELCMYAEHAPHPRLFSLPPQGGTLVLFMSAGMPHEVLAAQRERWSIAGWLRSC